MIHLSSHFGADNYYSEIKNSLDEIAFRQEQVEFYRQFIKAEIKRVRFFKKIIDCSNNKESVLEYL